VLKRIISFLRPALILIVVFMGVGLAGVGFQGIRTLQRLRIVEAERDQWQRPADIVRALNLKPGDVVVDFGSGAGYFALKLSDTVGSSGRYLQWICGGCPSYSCKSELFYKGSTTSRRSSAASMILTCRVERRIPFSLRIHTMS
jgi:hypothetical protein